MPWKYVINDLNGAFYEKVLEKNQKEFRIVKVIKKKGDKLNIKWKEYNNLLNGWIDKKDRQVIEYFAKPKFLGATVKVELDLSNCATKSDLKNVAGVDTSDFATSNFAKKTDLAHLKYDVDKLDIDKLKNVPSGLTV